MDFRQISHQFGHAITRKDRSISSQIVWLLILFHLMVLLILLMGVLASAFS